MSYRPYPSATPEFRLFQKTDGTTEMQVRYIKYEIGYVGKWMQMPIEKENDNYSNS